jgi:isopenicillin N synthase-like dioxygenase
VVVADVFSAQKLTDLAGHVASALAMVLGLDGDEFRGKLGQLDGQLRLLHYMPVPRKTLESGRNFRINPHCDYGLFTLLFQDAVGGLEVDRFHDGKFVPATPIPGTCVINVADILQRLSNDGLRSTRHRVMAPQLTQEQLDALGPDGYLPARFSTAFFVHPERTFLVDPIVNEGDEAHYEACVAGCWRDAITAKNYKLPIPMDTPEQIQAAKCVEGRYMMAANIEKKARVI